MILQQKIEQRKYSLVKTRTVIQQPKQSLTIPGQAFNLKLAMDQYKKGTLVERAKGYYEKQGFEAPDFTMMSYVEKLQALADFRRQAKEAAMRLDERDLKANQKYEKDVLEQQKQKQQKQDQGSRAKDNTDQPNSTGKD